VNLDGNAASHRALRVLGNEEPKWKWVKVRCCRYLNNVVEQDHRAIKRHCSSMLGLKSFKTAAITFAGVELAKRIREWQYSFGSSDQCRSWSLQQLWDRTLTPHSNLDTPHDECTRSGFILMFHPTRRGRGTKRRAPFSRMDLIRRVINHGE
jgi:DDE domain